MAPQTKSSRAGSAKAPKRKSYGFPSRKHLSPGHRIGKATTRRKLRARHETLSRTGRGGWRSIKYKGDTVGEARLGAHGRITRYALKGSEKAERKHVNKAEAWEVAHQKAKRKSKKGSKKRRGSKKGSKKRRTSKKGSKKRRGSRKGSKRTKRRGSKKGSKRTKRRGSKKGSKRTKRRGSRKGSKRHGSKRTRK
jgi:hypothetical protein